MTCQFLGMIWIVSDSRRQRILIPQADQDRTFFVNLES